MRRSCLRLRPLELRSRSPIRVSERFRAPMRSPTCAASFPIVVDPTAEERYGFEGMPPHRTAAQVGKGGVVTVNGVPAPEGEIVEVIVIRGADDAARYACAPVTPGEFSDVEDPLGWDGQGWDEFDDEAG